LKRITSSGGRESFFLGKYSEKEKGVGRGRGLFPQAGNEEGAGHPVGEEGTEEKDAD